MEKIMIVKKPERGEEEEAICYLFIGQKERKFKQLGKLKRSKKLINLNDHQVVRRPNLQILVLLSIAISICCSSRSCFVWPTCQAAEQQEAAAAKLPTVIVRGFLNYRTTVDGTVLLFTPDAGGQPSSSVAPISASSSATIGLELEAVSQSQPRPTQTAEFRPQAYQEEAEADQWRPIEATPPLKPVQSTFQLAAKPVQVETSSMLISADSSSSSGSFVEDLSSIGAPVGQAASQGRPTDKSLTETTRAANKPSVQTDELAAGAEHQKQQPTRAIMKARRPSLGFHGQGARANTRPANQAEQQNGNGSINGIRRPGLPTTTTTTTASVNAAEDTSQSQAQPVVNAFQARLQSAKLRNKFRKPGSSALGSSVGNSSTLTTTAAAAGSPAALLADDKDGLQQVGSSSNPSSIAVAAAADQWPVAAEMQPRLGDIFNPGAANLGAISPVVGSDEVLVDSSSSSSSSESEFGSDLLASDQQAGNKPESRLGEQRQRSDPELLTGGLTGTIESSGAPLTFDSFFQNDQPPTVGASKPGQAMSAASEHKPNHLAPRKKNNDKINGWLDHHHNKFVPRSPPTGAATSSPPPARVTLAPSFASNIPSVTPAQPTPTATLSASTSEPSVTQPTVGSPLEDPADQQQQASNSSSSPPVAGGEPTTGNSSDVVLLQMQTITKTYSTVMTSLKTRLVPLQVKSRTGVHTLTESYVITKLMTAYQTMPVGEFILPEPQSTRAPFEMFNEPADSQVGDQTKNKEHQASGAAVAAPSSFSAPTPESQEQPITLNENQKSPNDWLHDFTSQNPFNPSAAAAAQPQQQQLAAILEQQAQEANLANFGLSGEPLDQLASSLDPATLLADGSINIPDLNNPLVLAAAIQNPQLAAVILAAQQLRLRQQQQRAKQNGNNQQQVGAQQLLQPAAAAAAQLQPSYSTSLSTVIRPSTYTVRDTMYTTRLVSFKDGRTVRTRTVSEPGSVIEQILTTMATEVTPVTITIRPTGVLAAAGMQATAAATNNQATINNALFATQLANLLARRQQQVQPSTNVGGAPSQNQLTLLQQFLAGQQQLNGAATRPQQQQFQPNLQQLLQSMQQQSSAGNANANGQQTGNSKNKQAPASGPAQQDSESNKPEPMQPSTGATPPLPALPSKPFVTTLTNLQVRTYTVHNAFMTNYRTITSTQLVTSTILPAMMG